MRIIFTTFCLLISLSLVSFGQEKGKAKEIGLAFNNFDKFGFVYKIGHQKSMWRFNVIALRNSKSEVEEPEELDSESKNIGFNFSLGKEYYSDLATNFQFKYGWDLSYRYAKNEAESNQNNKLEAKHRDYGIDLVLGVNYPVSKHIILGAEVTPGFNWGKSEQKQNGQKTRETTNYGFGFSNNNARITLSYRF